MAQKQAIRARMLSVTLAGAVSAQLGDVKTGLEWAKSISLEAQITVAGGGTTAKAWFQTSLDNGATWVDLASFAFTTSSAKKLHALRLDVPTVLTPATAPSDGTLTDDTVLNGILGGQYRVKYTTTGTYTGASSLVVDAIFRG